MKKQPQESPVEPLLDAKEAAAILKVSPRMVQQYIKNGELVAIRLGKLVRITRTDLQHFILARRTRAP